MIPERTFASAEEMVAHYRALRARTGLDGRPAPVKKAEPALPAADGRSKPREPVKSIIARIAAEHGLTAKDILYRNRVSEVVAARDAAIAAAYLEWKGVHGLPWLARLFRRDHSTLHSSLQKSGLKPPTKKGLPRGCSVPRLLTQDQELTACRLYRAGLSCPRVAKRLAVSPGCVWDTLNRHGVAMRPAIARRAEARHAE